MWDFNSLKLAQMTLDYILKDICFQCLIDLCARGIVVALLKGNERKTLSGSTMTLCNSGAYLVV
jgi:hypothetical protein